MSKILSKLVFASCVWYPDREYYGLCVLIKDIGRWLPLQLQCSYQGQQYHIHINTLQLWDKNIRRNSYLHAVCDTPIARNAWCVSSLRI